MLCVLYVCVGVCIFLIDFVRVHVRVCVCVCMYVCVCVFDIFRSAEKRGP